MENWLNKYQDGGKVTYGTPEYTDAYNKGEVITKEGIHSPILLDEVTVRGKKKSKNWLEQYADKIVEENKDAGPLGAIIGTPLSAITSLPQMLATKLMSGKMQRPSEAMDIQNPVGAFTMDAIADPTNLIGAGLLTKEKVLSALTKGTEKELLSTAYKELPDIISTTPIREQFIQPKQRFSQGELSYEMEPYISQYMKPISREEEVFRNSLGREYYNKKLLEDTVNLDKEGNIISNKEGFSLSYKQILNLPEKEILEKTGKSKEDWELFINHKPDRYGKSLEDTFNSAYEPSLEQLQKVNKGKQQLTDFYNSSEYRNRLQNATGLDFDSAINKQTDLINSVNKTKPRYVQSTGYKSLESDAKAYTSGADSEGTKLGIDFSERGLNRPDAEYLASHEFGHTSLYDIKNHELLNKLPKLDLDSETLSNWKKWGDESKDTSYHDMIDYYSNPDEARQRGINAILYSKNKGISTDELVDIPYNDIITKNRSGDIPNDIMELRQLYDQKQLKGYLKNLFTITGVGTIGALQLKQNKNGGWLSKYN